MPTSTVYVQHGYLNGLQVMKFEQTTPYVESYEIYIPPSLWGSPVLALLDDSEQAENPDIRVKYESKNLEPGSSPLQAAYTLIDSGRYKQSNRDLYDQLERRFLNSHSIWNPSPSR